MNYYLVVCLLAFFVPIEVIAQGNLPWKRHTIDNTSYGSDGSKLADVNNDGNMDIVVGWEEGGVSRLYINPGTAGGSWKYVEVPSPDVEDAFAVDLDGDGFMDLVTLSEGNHQRITIHWAPATWEDYFHSEQWTSQDLPVTVGMTRWMFGRAADVDGKNGIDLIVGSKNPNGTLGWLEAPENPRDVNAWQYHELTAAGWIMSIELLDMDQDGHNDILLSDRYGDLRGVRWLKHPGMVEELTEPWQNTFIGVQEGEPMFLAVFEYPEATFTGIPAIAVPDLQSGWKIFYPDGKGWGNLSIAYPAFGGTRGKSVVVADVDQDGSLDLVASFEGAKDKSGVLTVNGMFEENPTFTDISGKAGVKFDFVVLIDMDGDGDLDVLTSEETAEDGSKRGLGVIWYENPLK